MHLAAALQQPEDGNLAGCATSSLALPSTAEIALIDLYLTAHKTWLRSSQRIEDDLPKLVKKQDRGVAVDPRQFGCRAGRRARAEILQKLDLDAFRKPAPTSCSNHLRGFLEIARWGFPIDLEHDSSLGCG